MAKYTIMDTVTTIAMASNNARIIRCVDNTGVATNEYGSVTDHPSTSNPWINNGEFTIKSSRETVPLVTSDVGAGQVLGNRIVTEARKWLGKIKYTPTGSSTSGASCSGFVHLVYKNSTGILVPPSSALLATNSTNLVAVGHDNVGIGKRMNELQPGDILIRLDNKNTEKYEGHVMLYAGNNHCIHLSTNTYTVSEFVLGERDGRANTQGYFEQFNVVRRLKGQQSANMPRPTTNKRNLESSIALAKSRLTASQLETIRSYCNTVGLPENIALGMMRQESGFVHGDSSGRLITSTAGAYGICQLVYGTTKGRAGAVNWAIEGGWGSLASSKTFDGNVSIGTRYLAYQIQAFGGNVQLGLAAYNGGAKRVWDALKKHKLEKNPVAVNFTTIAFDLKAESRNYVVSIFSHIGQDYTKPLVVSGLRWNAK